MGFCREMMTNYIKIDEWDVQVIIRNNNYRKPISAKQQVTKDFFVHAIISKLVFSST